MSGNHVHFDESGENLKCDEILVKKKSETKIEIQLGFLQINHVYEAKVILLAELLQTNLRYQLY